MKKKLTPKQKKFCLEFMIDLNATQAAIRAGYSKKTSAVIAWENLRKPLIVQFLNTLRNKQEKRIELTADYVLKTLLEIAEQCKEDNPSAANRSLELLGKYLSLFTERVEQTFIDKTYQDEHEEDSDLDLMNWRKERGWN